MKRLLDWMEQPWGEKTILLFLFCFSLTFHVAYVCHTGNWERSPAHDTVDFWRASDKVLAGEAWKKSSQAARLLDSWRTDTRIRSRNWEDSDYELAYFPLFPVYLSTLRVFFGDDLLLAHNMLFLRCLSLLLYSGVTVLAFLQARHYFGPAAALGAGLFCALNPNLMFWSHYVLTESVFTFALFLSLYWLVSGCAAPMRWGRIFFGILSFTAACLTRPILSPFGIPLALWLCVRMKGNTRFLRNFLFLIFGASLVFALVMGSGRMQGINRVLPWDFALKSFLVQLKRHYQRLEDSGSSGNNPASGDSFLKTWDASLQNKFRLAVPVLWENFLKYWHWSILQSEDTFQNSSVIRYYAFYYLLAFPCLLASAYFLMSRRQPERGGLFLLWLLLLYFTLVYTSTLRGESAANRYRVPIEPGIAILAGFTLSRIAAPRGRSDPAFFPLGGRPENH